MYRATPFLFGLLLLPTLLQAEYVQRDHEAKREEGRLQSLYVLQKAFDRARKLPSPEAAYVQIAEAGIASHHYQSVLPLIREMAADLKRFDRAGYWPDSKVNAYAAFARLVAPFDKQLRDDLLTAAIRRPMATIDDALEEDKQSLQLKIRYQLWSLIMRMEQDDTRDLAKIELRMLRERAKALGFKAHKEVKEIQVYEQLLMDEMTALNPSLVPGLWPKRLKRALPAYFLEKAIELDAATFGQNPWAKYILAYLYKYGDQDIQMVELQMRYDLDKAYLLARDLKSDYHRRRIMPKIIWEMAWKKPDDAIALAMAISEKDVKTRALSIHAAASVHAYQKPHGLERLKMFLDEGLDWSTIKLLAQNEILRRENGYLPTISPDVFSSNPRTLTAARFACTPSQRDNRVTQLAGMIYDAPYQPDAFLYEMACLWVHDAHVARNMMGYVVQGAQDRDQYLFRLIDYLGYYGDQAVAEEMLADFQFDENYIAAATKLAGHMVHRYHEMDGREKLRIIDRPGLRKKKDYRKILDQADEIRFAGFLVK